MNEEIAVEWEVGDGYVGKSRPQSTLIDVEDFDADMTEGEMEDLVYQMVDDDFRQTITPDIGNMDTVIEQIQTALTARDNDR